MRCAIRACVRIHVLQCVELSGIQICLHVHTQTQTHTCLSNFQAVSCRDCRAMYRYIYICTHTHVYIHSYIHTYSLSDEVDHSEKKPAAAGRVGFGDEVPGGGGAKAATGSTREAEEEEEEAAGPGALTPMVDVSDVKVFVMSASFF